MNILNEFDLLCTCKHSGITLDKNRDASILKSKPTELSTK